MNWKSYEDETAEFFRSLGCDAEVDATIKGARAEHKIDVWVRFTRFGVETRWVVECKFWQSSVPKEKVLALRSVVEDVGADRGILISKAGFQAGAVRAAEYTNITLTGLDELKQTAQDDLVLSVLHTLETKATKLRHLLHKLYSFEQRGPDSWTGKPLPGVSGDAVMGAIGKLAILQFGFERVRLHQPPFPIGFDDSGEHQILTTTLEEFVDRAAGVIADAQATLECNKQKITT